MIPTTFGSTGTSKLPKVGTNIRTPDCWPWKILASRRTLPDWAGPALNCSHFSRFPFVPDSWLLSIWGIGFRIYPLSLVFIHSSIPPLGIPPRSNRTSTLPGHWTGCWICMKNATTPKYSPTPRKVWTLDGSGWIRFDFVAQVFLLRVFSSTTACCQLVFWRRLTHWKTKLGLSIIHADDRNAIKGYDDERYQYRIVL